MADFRLAGELLREQLQRMRSGMSPRGQELLAYMQNSGIEDSSRRELPYPQLSGSSSAG